MDYLFTIVKGNDGNSRLRASNLLNILGIVLFFIFVILLFALIILRIKKKSLKKQFSYYAKKIVPIIASTIILITVIIVLMNPISTYGWARSRTRDVSLEWSSSALGRQGRDPEKILNDFSRYPWVFDSGKSAHLLEIIISQQNHSIIRNSIDNYLANRNPAMSMEYILSVIGAGIIDSQRLDYSLEMFKEFKDDYNEAIPDYWQEKAVFRNTITSINDDDGQILEQIRMGEGASSNKAIVYLVDINITETGKVTESAIPLNLMAQLDDDLLPGSSEELKYVIYIEREYQADATYSGIWGYESASGYREHATVKVLSVPGLIEIFDCGESIGPELPETINLDRDEKYFKAGPVSDDIINEMFDTAVEYIIKHNM